MVAATLVFKHVTKTKIGRALVYGNVATPEEACARETARSIFLNATEKQTQETWRMAW
jgi:hypothetical protein